MEHHGTWVNGIRLIQSCNQILRHHDEIEVGKGPERVSFTVKLLPIGPAYQSSASRKIQSLYILKENELGKGGYGTVVPGTEISTGRMYAVKIMRKADKKNAKAIEREVDALARLSHPNIVRLKDSFQGTESFYVVMEYVSKGDLHDFITQRGPIKERNVQEISRQVFSAVDYMHSLNISHRDITPRNILLVRTRPFFVKLADFGLAKISKKYLPIQTVCGTPPFAAPEVLSKGIFRLWEKTYTNKVDIWSVGCTIFFLLSGTLPFPGRTMEQVYENIIAGMSTQSLQARKVSEEAIQCIAFLLQIEPVYRPTAEQALHMAWLGRKASKKPSFSEPLILDAPRESISLYEPLLQPGLIIGQSLSNNFEKEGIFAVSDPNGGISAEYGQTTSLSTQSKSIENTKSPSMIQDFYTDSSESDYSIGTWLALETLNNSIPVGNLCITDTKATIGSLFHFEVELYIDHPKISKRHCFVYKEQEINSQDNQSTVNTAWLACTSPAGCYINGKLIGEGQQALLQQGDEVYLYWDPKINELIGFRVAFDKPKAFARRDLREDCIIPIRYVSSEQ